MRKGFTLIEMVVVLACITILSAVIVPNVLSSFESTKLKSDIQSAMIIQNALELYMMETGKKPAASTADDLIKELKNNDYIKSIGSTPQLSGAKWNYDKNANSVKLDLSGCGAGVKKTAANLSSQELLYITGAGG